MSDTASHLTVRRIPPALTSALTRERRRRNASLNSTVISLLSRALGIDEPVGSRSNGLGKLAGKWTAGDGDAFKRATASTRLVDQDLWP